MRQSVPLSPLLSRVFVAGLVLLVLAACGSDATGPTDPADPDGSTGAVAGGKALADQLRGREFWSVDVVDNGAPRALVEGTRITLRFEDDRIGVSAGCNSIGGTASFDGDRLVATELFMTEMGCDPERHAQDQFVIEVLSAGPAVTVEGDDLSLETDAVTMRFLDAEIANPDRPLVGTAWTVTGFEDSETATAFGVARDASLAFGDDSTLRGFDGCADFEAAVEIADGSIGGPVEGDGELQFGPVAWTPIEECPDAEYVAMVRRVFDAGSATFTIDGTNLRVIGPDGFGLTARAG